MDRPKTSCPQSFDQRGYKILFKVEMDNFIPFIVFNITNSPWYMNGHQKPVMYNYLFCSESDSNHEKNIKQKEISTTFLWGVMRNKALSYIIFKLNRTLLM